MKKLLTSIFVLLLCTISVQAQQKQGVKLEGSLGFPSGDLSSSLVFGLGADLSYLFDLTDSFQTGLSLGYHNFFAKSDRSLPSTLSSKGEDFQFVPLAASSRYYITEEFFVGADLGYAFVLTDGIDGGVHYKPKLAYSFGLITTSISYSGVVLDDDSFNSINLGFEVAF